MATIRDLASGKTHSLRGDTLTAPDPGGLEDEGATEHATGSVRLAGREIGERFLVRDRRGDGTGEIGLYFGASEFYADIRRAIDGGAVPRLTTDHAASSHGLPVVVVGGLAYGPADLGPQHALVIRDLGGEVVGDSPLDVLAPPQAAPVISREGLRQAARLAGYTVAE